MTEAGEQDLADYINRKYAEAVLPLLGERNAIDRELITLDEAGGMGRYFSSMIRSPLPDQVELVAKRAEINKRIRAFQSQSQEKRWIREYGWGRYATDIFATDFPVGCNTTD